MIRPARAALRRRGEEGFVGGLAGMVFGLLLFVVGTLVVANAWAVVDTKAAATEAARQAARTYVEAANPDLASQGAQQAADATLSGSGRDPAKASVTLASGYFARCERITISVSYPAPLLVLPFVGRVGTGELVRAQNSELVDPFGSGLPGTSACA